MLNNKKKFAAFEKIEQKRQQLLKDSRVLSVEDFGAGSAQGSQKKRAVAAIAKNAAKSKKLGQLLFRIANYYQPACILELGTSLGLSAAYLASGHPAADLLTLEGAEAIATVARENFTDLGIHNIEIVTGNFDNTLPVVLKHTREIDLAFIDGNHRRVPTLRYFEELLQQINRPGILIFDDIHWSSEMEEAWDEIKKHPAVMLTIDLFFIGLVFFSKDFKVKQHFVIRF